jgi:hypothetical protein
MRNMRAAWRLGALLLVLVAILSPIGVGARTRLSCDDFNDLDAAQFVLDADPSQARRLDADGDGIACNEDAEASDQDDADDPDEDTAGYLEAVRGELTLLANSGVRFEGLIADADVDEEEKAELEEIVTFWQTAPMRAGKLEAPDGLEDVQDAYLATAEAFADAQVALSAWLRAEPDTAADDEGAAAFVETYLEATALALDLDQKLTAEGA